MKTVYPPVLWELGIVREGVEGGHTFGGLKGPHAEVNVVIAYVIAVQLQICPKRPIYHKQ